MEAIAKVTKSKIMVACISDAWDYAEALRRIRFGAYYNGINIQAFLSEVKMCSIPRLIKLCKKHNINVY